MTIEHIKPKSKRGRSQFSNYLIVCKFHNGLRANMPLKKLGVADLA